MGLDRFHTFRSTLNLVPICGFCVRPVSGFGCLGFLEGVPKLKFKAGSEAYEIKTQ